MLHHRAHCAAIVAALALGGCAINPPLPPHTSPKPAPIIGKSRLAVSLKTSWPALASRVNDAIPRCGGIYQGDDNSACLGTEQSGNFIVQREDAKEYLAPGDTVWFQGSVWRWDPVAMSLNNGQLEAGLKSLYHIRVGWDPFGSVGSCGYGQPARFMYVGLRGPLGLNPGWYVDPNLSTYASNDPGRPCRVTVLNIEASSIIERTANRALDGAKNKAQDRIREKTNFRSRAMEIWSVLNNPVKLTDRVWLSINPESAHAGALSVIGQDLTIPVALEASPKITVGAMPPQGNLPLPDLVTGPLDPSFNINLRGGISFAELSRKIRDEFSGRQFTLGTRWPFSQMTFVIADVEATGSGDKVIVAVKIDGFAKGTLYFYGTPVFVPGPSRLQGNISIEGVDYSLETKNILAHFGNIIFHNLLQDRIQSAAKLDISRQLQRSYDQLNTAINRDLSQDAKMEGRISEFGPGKIWVGGTGVEAHYSVKGELSVIVSPL